MIVTFFPGDYTTIRGSGSPNTNGIDYLLNKSRSVEPVVLSGNPDITRQLLLESDYKKAFTYGCLSFEEKTIDHDAKFKHMAEFEQVLMAGYSSEEYDILWVEHADKGRVELNFHLVNTNLTTGQQLQPFYHKRDVPRIDAWKNITNAEYGYSDPNDPSKARTMAQGNVPKAVLTDKEHIDNYVISKINDGEVNNRSQMVDLLNALDGVEVSRQTKKAISLKVEGHKRPLRMTGKPYEQDFRGGESLRNEQAASIGKYHESRTERLAADKARLNSMCQRIAEHRVSRTKKTLENREQRLQKLADRGHKEPQSKLYYQNNDHSDYHNSVINDWDSDRDLHVPSYSHTIDTKKHLASMSKNRETEQQNVLQNLITVPNNNNNKVDNYNEITTKNSTELDTDDLGRIINNINRVFKEEQQRARTITQRIKQIRDITETVIQYSTRLVGTVFDRIRGKIEQSHNEIDRTTAAIDRFGETINAREAGSRELAAKFGQVEQNLIQVPAKLIEAIAKRESNNYKGYQQTNDLSL
ncbi:relaxase/mobilization nuclease domain-containing protein [Photobacterium piscicola]|uniref:relaxase/mobilization nuclease domain-containing protein n=1 Tax=Photobacterium piscicola TaxID=1378299 RepID=UPI002E178DD1|nr:relaxase/mobilization nuclease domain-containing protein [Photobacterium piscicola]